MRIMGGELKGRTIRCPRKGAVRPVLGRLRESLFSILGSLDSLDVLDLFAGTGSLGLESLSRGAGFAAFVEKDRTVLRFLARNVQELDLERKTRIYPMDAFDYLSRVDPGDRGYPIVFADPPYRRGDVHRLLDAFREAYWSGSLIVIKHSFREELPGCLERLRLVKVLERGDDRISILRGGNGVETGSLSGNVRSDH